MSTGPVDSQISYSTPPISVASASSSTSASLTTIESSVITSASFVVPSSTPLSSTASSRGSRTAIPLDQFPEETTSVFTSIAIPTISSLTSSSSIRTALTSGGSPSSPSGTNVITSKMPATPSSVTVLTSSKTSKSSVLSSTVSTVRSSSRRSANAATRNDAAQLIPTTSSEGRIALVTESSTKASSEVISSSQSPTAPSVKPSSSARTTIPTKSVDSTTSIKESVTSKTSPSVVAIAPTTKVTTTNTGTKATLPLTSSTARPSNQSDVAVQDERNTSSPSDRTSSQAQASSAGLRNTSGKADALPTSSVGENSVPGTSRQGKGDSTELSGTAAARTQGGVSTTAPVNHGQEVGTTNVGSVQTTSNDLGVHTTPTSLPSSSSQRNASFFDNKATVGGVFAVVAFLILAFIVGAVLVCSRRRKRAMAERHRRWHRGISWPASARDNEGDESPIIGNPRSAPSPPMSQVTNTQAMGPQRFSSPLSLNEDPFGASMQAPLRMPPTMAIPAVMGTRQESPNRDSLGHPFRTMYPDRLSDPRSGMGVAITKDSSFYEPSEHSSAHRASPSMAPSSPSMYAASLPDSDVDSLYTREHASGRPMDPFMDSVISTAAVPLRSQPSSATTPTSPTFSINRKPAPPVPPRHRSRPSLGLITPPSSNSDHSRPASPFDLKAELAAQGMGLTMQPVSPTTPAAMEERMLTPTRRTFLNIRPKRNSADAVSSGGSTA